MKQQWICNIIISGIGIFLITSFMKASSEDPKTPLSEFTTDLHDNFVYDDHGQRDPFWPLVTSSGGIITHEKDLTIADLVLEGIMTGSNGGNAAIINGHILKSDEVLGSFVIKNIEADCVVLQKGDQIFTLKLKKEE